MNKILFLLIISIDLAFAVKFQFRKYVLCGYDVWIRKHDKNQNNVLEIIETIKSQGLLNTKYDSPESPDQESSSSSSSSSSSDDSAYSYDSEQEITSLYTPETLQIETPTFKKPLTDWSLETGSRPRSPRPHSLQKLAIKITKKDSILSNDSNNISLNQKSILQHASYYSYLGDSAISYDLSGGIKWVQKQIQDKSTKIHKNQLKTTRQIVREQQMNITKMKDKIEELQNMNECNQKLISFKTINNVLQNEINNKTTRIKQMEEDHLNELKGKQEINTKKKQKLMNYIEKLEHEIARKYKYQQQLIQQNYDKSKEIVHCLNELNVTRLIIEEQQMNITKMENDNREKIKKLQNDIARISDYYKQICSDSNMH